MNIRYKFFKASILTLLTSTAFAEYTCPAGNQECLQTKTFLETFSTDLEKRIGEIGVKLASAAEDASSIASVSILLDPPKQVQKTMMGMGKAKTQNNPQPTPEALDAALLQATGSGNIAAINLILGYEHVKNTQAGINASYRKGVKAQKIDAVQAILDNSSIKPDAAGVNETLTTVVHLKKAIDAKKQMIEFLYTAPIKPTAAHTQVVYDTILATPALQALGEWFASLVQGAGFTLTVATAANESPRTVATAANESPRTVATAANKSPRGQAAETANAEDATLTNADRELIAACTPFNADNVGNVVEGKKEQLTQPGLNKALMKILTSTDPNYMHYTGFMSFFRKGNIQFAQETANAILMFAAKTERTNLLLQFDKRSVSIAN